MSRFIRARLITLVGLFLIGVAAVGSTTFLRGAHAASGQAFTITPPLVNIKGDPGKTVTAQIKLTNISQGSLDIQSDANDFGAKDETGDPNIIFDTSKATPYSMRNWVQLPDLFTLASKETKTLSIPIAIPANAEPGGHYAVVRFTGSASGGQDSVALSASIGSLILLQVSGNVQAHAHIAQFFTANDKYAQQSLFEQAPIKLVERIQNSGNVHLQPTGTVAIKNMFGQTVRTMRVNGDPSAKNNPPKNVLPASIRRFDQTLNDGWMFGRYTAHLALTYGDSHTPLTADLAFWVIPYRLIIVIVVILAAGAALVIMIIRRQRRSKVWSAQPQNTTLGKKGKGPFKKQ